MKRKEEQLIREASLAVVPSDRERTLLSGKWPLSSVVVVPNCVDTARIVPLVDAGGQDLLFVGSLDYLPNQDAVLYFVTDILPLLQAEFSRLTFTVVGRGAPPGIKGLSGRPGVRVFSNVTAKGWETRSFQDRVFVHHRPMGTRDRGVLAAKFSHGQKDHIIGNAPLWELFRCVFQMKNQPYCLGGLMMMLGYLYRSSVRGREPIPAELIEFHRREQSVRLSMMLKSTLKRYGSGGMQSIKRLRSWPG